MIARSSDFYQARRAGIRDLFGALGFLVGFIGSGPYGWPLMMASVDAGEMAQGLFKFFGVVIVGGVGAGIAGLLVGIVVGRVWELAHRAWRGAPRPDAGEGATAEAVVVRPTRKPDVAYAVTYDTQPLTSDAFLDLARRTWPRDYDVAAAADALARTTNIGAWHNARLVGSVRILTDGYFFATVPDLMVDPDYRVLGIGRELMRRALDVAPRGTLFFGAQRDAVRFFERIGAVRGPTGFVLRRGDPGRASTAVLALLVAASALTIGCGGHREAATAPDSTATSGGECVALSAGGVSTTLPGTSVCLPGGTAGATYVVIPFHRSAVPGGRASITFTATALAAALADRTTPAPSAPVRVVRRPSVAVSFESRLRRRERRELTPLIPAAHDWQRRTANGRSASRSAIPSSPAPGDILQLNANADDNCSNPKLRSGRVVAVTSKAIVVADVANPSGGYTDAEYQSLGVTFDTLVDPLDRLNFGDPADIDHNGRVLLFFTRTVNDLTPVGSESFIGGYFAARDLFPTSASSVPPLDPCPASNVGEMFYLIVPDPSRGAIFSKTNVKTIAIGTLAHEYQHLINASRRLYINTAAEDFEEVWLNEGLSHIAEELLFYHTGSLAPRGNIGLGLLQSDNAALDAFNAQQISNADRYAAFLRKPGEYSPWADNDSLETRGATWSLLRFAADHNPQPEQAIWRALVNSTTSGLTNLQQVLATDIMSLTRDWTISVYGDDLGVAAAYQQPSWNMRSILPEIESGSFPLGTVPLGLSQPQSVAVSAGSAVYATVTVQPGARTLLSWTTASPNLQLSVLRAR